jgi:alpha-galactosidase
MTDIQGRLLHIATAHTSYIIGADGGGLLLQHYYGVRISDAAAAWDTVSTTRGTCLFDAEDTGSTAPLNRMPEEYQGYGCGSYLPSACAARRGGADATRLRFVRFFVPKAAEKNAGGLPHPLEPDEEVCAELRDGLTGLRVVLRYSVFYDCDVITRGVTLENTGSEPLFIDRVMSLSLHFDGSGYELIHLDGRWAKERTPVRAPVTSGTVSIGSARGESSHECNPFFALVQPETTDSVGEAYGCNLVYSGNWLAEIMCDSYGCLHAVSGINPETFTWKLEPGGVFTAPDAALTFSAHGLNGMSQNFHKFVNEHIVRGYWKDRVRPVLVNSWEAMYFDFDEDKLLALAERAKELGIEMLVLDDGWFGRRDDDTTSLGDWTPDLSKLPHGIDGLAGKIHEMGLKFGLWFEPEMISPESELYRAHPDWCICAPGRRPPLCRNQLVLDMSNPLVTEYLYGAMAKILRGARVDYVKWDMNRPLTCLGSSSLPADRQREQSHRYVLGLYSLIGRLTEEFPEVLFEGCSGGGARFDLGMLCFCPQIWCSDNTDPEFRLFIQNGTSYAYPVSVMGSHVSASPNHHTRAATSMELRAAVALAGSFGYELDLGALGAEDRESIKKQIKLYHETYSLIHAGSFCRLREPGSGPYSAWQFVSADGARSMAFVFYSETSPDVSFGRLRLCGLDPSAEYEVTDGGLYGDTPHGDTSHGDTLMGLGVPLLPGPYRGQVQVVRLTKKA